MKLEFLSSSGLSVGYSGSAQRPAPVFRPHVFQLWDHAEELRLGSGIGVSAICKAVPGAGANSACMAAFCTSDPSRLLYLDCTVRARQRTAKERWRHVGRARRRDDASSIHFSLDASRGPQAVSKYYLPKV